MNITGILTEIKPLRDPVGQNNTRYAFGKLQIADGRTVDLMFVNRTFMELANRPVVISDISQEQNKIRWEADKGRYRIYGSGVSITCDGQEYAGSAAPSAPPVAAGPPPGASGPPSGAFGSPPGASAPSQPARAAAPCGASMEDVIDYGLNAVNYARFCGEACQSVLQSVFGSAVHGYKEGRAMDGPETWAARKTFEASSDAPGALPPSVDPEEEDDIPF